MFPSARKSHDFPVYLYLLIISAFYLRRKRSGNPYTRCHISAFDFTGCGLQRRSALLPRDRKPAPESAIF
ncbi:hypothetical protein RXN83_20375, partial [Salmonella enterica subsp. enterica serovar Shamba]|uniref:hypothetical protein n=1 Tax=Salmonella enterica TaxID=28901 RepID=UPI002932837B